MKLSDFETFETSITPELISLLEELKKNIGDDYRASDDPQDDTPGMQITISTNENLSHWHYQTGDNSYTGNCYDDPYWGVDFLYRDTDCKELAHALLDDLANQIEFKD